MTNISWASTTTNPFTGCLPDSEGCMNCYAIGQSWRNANNPIIASKYEGVVRKTTAGNLKFTGKVNFLESALYPMMRWSKPQYNFMGSMADLFYKEIKKEWLDIVFAYMLCAPKHVHMVLTKRPGRMREYIENNFGSLSMINHMEEVRKNFDKYEHLLHNFVEFLPDSERCGCRVGPEDTTPCGIYDKRKVGFCDLDEEVGFGYSYNSIFRIIEEKVQHIWYGVSVENQEQADRRIPELLELKTGGLKYLSLEPLIGPVDLNQYIEYLDYLIIGGESGTKARPVHPDWVRQIVEVAQKHNKIIHFKQWGTWLPWEMTGTPRMMLSQDGQEQDIWQMDMELANGDWNSKKWYEILSTIDEFTPLYNKGRDYLLAFEKVGKSKSGYMLDGKEYREFPEMPAYCQHKLK